MLKVIWEQSIALSRLWYNHLVLILIVQTTHAWYLSNDFVSGPWHHLGFDDKYLLLPAGLDIGLINFNFIYHISNTSLIPSMNAGPCLQIHLVFTLGRFRHFLFSI